MNRHKILIDFIVRPVIRLFGSQYR